MSWRGKGGIGDHVVSMMMIMECYSVNQLKILDFYVKMNILKEFLDSLV